MPKKKTDPGEEPKVEEPQVKEPKAEEPKAEEPTVKEPKETTHEPLGNGRAALARKIGIGVAAVLILLITFWAGMFVGFQKARFSYRWGEYYYQHFGGPVPAPRARPGLPIPQPPLPSPGRGLFGGHGASGEIVRIDDGTIVVKDRANVEKVVLITDKTTIVRGWETVDKEDLRVDDGVTVIGVPNEKGQIEARLIRVFGPK